MKKILIVSILVGICLLISSCDYGVSAEDHRTLQRDFQTQLEINSQLKEEMRGLKGELEQLRAQLDQTKAELAWAQANPPDLELEAMEDDLPPLVEPVDDPDDEAQGASSQTQAASSAASSEPTLSSSAPAAPPASSASSAPRSPAPQVTDEERTKFDSIAGLIS